MSAMHLYPGPFTIDNQAKTHSGSLNFVGLIIAVCSMGITGLGATAGLMSGLTSVARSFPKNTVSEKRSPPPDYTDIGRRGLVLPLSV